MFKSIKRNFIIVCLLVAFAMTFSSCQKEERLIQGSWETVTEDEEPQGEIWTFGKDGSLVVVYDKEYLSGFYSIQENSLSIHIEGDDYSTIWEIDGSYVIVKLDKNRLIISGTWRVNSSNYDHLLSYSGKIVLLRLK